MMLLVWKFSYCHLRGVVTKLICLSMASALIRIFWFPGHYWLLIFVTLVTAHARVSMHISGFIVLSPRVRTRSLA